MKDNQKRLYYTTIYAQCFSPCGRYLAVGTSFGNISIFNVHQLFNPVPDRIATEDIVEPLFSFEAHDGPIYTLASNGACLISAGTGDINAWRWEDILKKLVKVVWSLSIKQRDAYMKPEVNQIVLGVSNIENVLYAGCGDNSVYAYDLEHGTEKAQLSGHDDYVHCLTLTQNGQQLLSGGEDGNVIIWDARRYGRPVHKLEPYKDPECARPRVGKWIGCLALDASDDWLICGGGPKLSTWHLRSLSCTTRFPLENSQQNAVLFHKDEILSAGNENSVYKWSFNGDLNAKLPTESQNIYSLAVNKVEGGQEALAVAGCGPKIDLYSKVLLRDYQLTLV